MAFWHRRRDIPRAALWLLLDVDGTLSPGGPLRDAEPPLMASGVSGNVAVRAAVARRLVEVFREGTVNLGWYTSWGDEANEVVAPLLGLPPLPVVPMGVGWDQYADLKANGISSWAPALVAGARVAILDDDLPSRLRFPSAVTTFTCDPRAGVTVDMIDSAVAFLTSDQ